MTILNVALSTISSGGGGGGSSWLLAGNSLTSVGLLGSLNAYDVSMVANGVEIARLINSTGALQVNANSTFGGQPNGLITGNSASGFLILSAVPLSGGNPNGGSLLLGGSTNPDAPNAVGLFAPSSFVGFIFANSSPPASVMTAQGLCLGGLSTNFGNATADVISIKNQTANPTTAATGFGTIFVGTDNNLYYLNATSTYQLTPPSGGSSGWALTGNTLSALGIFGSLNAFDVSMRANNVEIARLVETTGALQIASNATIGGGGGFPASVITGTLATGSLLLTSTPLSSMTPTGGSVVLGGSTNAALANSVALISPSTGGTVFINSVSTGPFAGVFTPGLLLGSGTPSNFGNATANVISIANQVTNPTVSASGYATMYVGTDNNLYFLNNTSNYKLTPPDTAMSYVVWSTFSGTSVTMVAGTGYISTNSAAVTLNLPSSPTVGQIFGVVGLGAGLFNVVAPSGATIGFAGATSVSGGQVASTHVDDNLIILCTQTSPSIHFTVINSTGPEFNVT